MRRVEFLGIAQSYEVTAVFGNGGVRGGVDDAEIPNFFRWTERELEKTINTRAPQLRHGYCLDPPQTPASLRNSFFSWLLVQAI
jgi:hypothetical protein